MERKSGLSKFSLFERFFRLERFEPLEILFEKRTRSLTLNKFVNLTVRSLEFVELGRQFTVKYPFRFVYRVAGGPKAVKINVPCAGSRGGERAKPQVSPGYLWRSVIRYDGETGDVYGRGGRQTFGRSAFSAAKKLSFRGLHRSFSCLSILLFLLSLPTLS